MHSLRHIAGSLVLLAVGFTAFLLLRKVVGSEWVLVKSEKEQEEIVGRCGNETMGLNNGVSASTYRMGSQLFKANCATCHALDKHLTGPALRGFAERGPWGDRKELYKWIKNPAGYMKSSVYTQNLLTQYGAVMQGFPNLTDAEIDAIAGYIGAPPAVAKR